MNAAERDLLVAVVESLSLPDAATDTDDAARQHIMRMRVIDVLTVLRSVLDDMCPSVEWLTGHLRDLAKQSPAIYVTYDQVVAATERGMSWTEALNTLRKESGQ